MGRFGGLLVPFFIASWFGAQGATDRFFIVYSMVSVLQGIFTVLLENLTIPYLIDLTAQKKNPSHFMSHIMTAGTATIAVILLILLLLFPPFGTLSAATAQFRTMLWLFSPVALIAFWSSGFCGVLNSGKRFALPALSHLIRAAAVLGFAYVTRQWLGIYGVIVGFLIGESIRLLAMHRATSKWTEIRLRISWKLESAERLFLAQALLQISANAANSINFMVDKFMASRLAEGKVSLLHYAERLYLIPLAFILHGFMAPILAHWSDRYTKGGIPALRYNLRRGTIKIALFTMGGTLFLFFVRQPLIKLALAHGRFPAELLDEVGWIFAAYLIGLIPSALLALQVRALMVIRQILPIAVGAIVSILINFGCNLLFIRIWGAVGIALSTSLVHLLFFLYLWIVFDRKSRSLLAAPGSTKTPS